MNTLDALQHCADSGERVTITYPGGATLSGTIEHDGDREYVLMLPRPFTKPVGTFIIPDMVYALTINRETIYQREPTP